MDSPTQSPLPVLLDKHEAALLEDWMKEQLSVSTRRKDLLKDAELREQSRAFIQELRKAAQSDRLDDIQAPAWTSMRELLGGLSRARAKLGFSPSEIARFVLSFKQPLFARLRAELAGSPEQLAEVLWITTNLLDNLGLHTTEVFQKAREEIINRQQEEMLELSTPVVELWDGILALPLIGTLDSRRTQTVMETLLQRIVETESEIAIIDITGVPTVDTLTAQHLLRTVTATRLMGADCIISGIRPQIAQTIVHLGVDLGDVLTKSTLAGALALALKKRQLAIVKTSQRPGEK